MPASFQPERAVLLFPSDGAQPIDQVDWSAFDTVVVIDGTWQQARSMLNNKQSPITGIKTHVCLNAEGLETRFWRYQKFGPHCLSTIEAIHRFFVELPQQDCSLAKKDIHQYDNLLWFFAWFYQLIQQNYREDPTRQYTSRHRPGYIISRH